MGAYQGAERQDPQGKHETTAKPAPPVEHTWAGAAMVVLDPAAARTAERYGWVDPTKLELGPRDLKIVEVLCIACRRTWAAVNGEPCQAKTDNSHLIGGTPGKRNRKPGTVDRQNMVKPGLNDQVLATAG